MHTARFQHRYIVSIGTCVSVCFVVGHTCNIWVRKLCLWERIIFNVKILIVWFPFKHIRLCMCVYVAFSLSLSPFSFHLCRRCDGFNQKRICRIEWQQYTINLQDYHFCVVIMCACVRACVRWNYGCEYVFFLSFSSVVAFLFAVCQISNTLQIRGIYDSLFFFLIAANMKQQRMYICVLHCNILQTV